MGYCAKTLDFCGALLCGDLHCAQDSLIRRPSLDAELDCVAALRTLTRYTESLVGDPRSGQSSHNSETRTLRRALLCRDLRPAQSGASAFSPPLCTAARCCRNWPALPDENWVRFVMGAWRSLLLAAGTLSLCFSLKRKLDQLANCFRTGGLVWLLLRPGFDSRPQRRRKAYR